MEDRDSALGNVRISNRQIILVVDDMPANFTMIMNMLPASYEISTAKSGPEALDLLDRSFVDLALLDIEMPEMSGIELFQKMQENPDYDSIPVIFVTSDKDTQTVQRAITLGAKDYIVKPFNERTLQAKVARALKGNLMDQAELFLRRKVKVIQECCWNGNIGLAEITMREIPKSVYSKFVFHRLSRVLMALRNRDVKQASEIAEEIMKEL